MLVLDASLTLAHSFESQSTTEIDAVMRTVESHGAIVPAAWVAEHWNGLWNAARRRGLSDDDILKIWYIVRLFPIEIEAPNASRVASVVFPLARRHDLTIYDATYLEAAMRKGLPIATCDRSQRRAADREGVPCQFFEPKSPDGA